MLNDILRDEAAALDDEFADHDTDAFTRRLAVRIAETAGQTTGRVGGHVTNDKRPGDARPPRRPVRRRPTPIVTSDPAVSPPAMFAEVGRLCDLVLRSRDIELLADFAADFDQVGARTFGCLLYTLDRHESGLYWWRFAAGAGDELAAHLLAVHHAAAGNTTHARLWRAIARMMGFAPELHLPRSIHGHADPPEHVVSAVDWTSQMQTFLRMTHLPRELAA
jgi:hypothetical protein